MVEGVFSRASRNRLTHHDLDRFAGRTLLDRVGRVVCVAECLPRKELFEAWEVARRVRRLFRGGRVVDVGAGHGLLAQILLLLDDSSPEAVIVDPRLPPSSAAVHRGLLEQWPRLAERVTFNLCAFDAIELRTTDLVVSSHACGSLTDEVLHRAATARARVAVLPCCHDFATCDAGGLAGWMPAPLAIDATRARRLASQGYRVWTQTIPEEVTPKNRLLLGEPQSLG
jgi:hypothetical protein